MDTGRQLASILANFAASVTLIEASLDLVTVLRAPGATQRATTVHALLWGTTSSRLPGGAEHLGGSPKKGRAWRLTVGDASLLSGYRRL
jgi:hypothetical protein